MNRNSATWMAATRVWIPIAAALFTVALIVSAVVLPELRLLHVLQALIYVAIVILARRNSMWAIGAGLTIAVVWNSLNLFVTHNMQRGVTVFWSLLQTGQMRDLGPHPIVPMMVLLGGIGHFVLHRTRSIADSANSVPPLSVVAVRLVFTPKVPTPSLRHVLATYARAINSITDSRHPVGRLRCGSRSRKLSSALYVERSSLPVNDDWLRRTAPPGPSATLIRTARPMRGTS
jgi:hypothetical protein